MSSVSVISLAPIQFGGQTRSSDCSLPDIHLPPRMSDSSHGRSHLRKLWITWERHRRTTELSTALNGVRLLVLQLNANRLARYIYLLVMTSQVLIREMPHLVIVQCPSVLLALFMVTFGKMIASKVIVDAHNEGLKPFHRKYSALLPIYRFIQRRADLTIVTNERLAKGVANNGGHPFVLEDKIPEFQTPSRGSLQGRFNIAYICSFEKDEPYMEVLQAARIVDPSIFIYVTGNYRKSPGVLKVAPPNVVFTGFLSEKDYVDLLFSCDAVMDLTLMEDCLVCGAYEGVALGKPLILSDSKASVRYFHSGAIHTENDPQSIAAAVRSTVEEFALLSMQVEELRRTALAVWKEKLNDLERYLK